METVIGVVGKTDCFLLGVVGKHTEHWAENFFLCDSHTVLHIDKHCRLHEKARLKTLGTTFSADQYLRAFFDAFADVGFHALILLLRYHRPNHDLGIGWLPYRVVPHLALDGQLRLFEPTLGHEEASSGGAGLTAV